MAPAREKTTHILNASSNLLGFCFFILVSIRALGIHPANVIEEVVSVSILLFVVSSFLSFLSIRSTSARRERFESFADYVFVAGLASLLIITALILLSVL